MIFIGANRSSDYRINLKSKKTWVNKYIPPKIKSFESIYSKKKDQKGI